MDVTTQQNGGSVCLLSGHEEELRGESGLQSDHSPEKERRWAAGGKHLGNKASATGFLVCGLLSKRETVRVESQDLPLPLAQVQLSTEPDTR